MTRNTLSSGLTSEVTVFLKGSNRVALANEMQPGTRKFRVVADLRKAKEGTVEVPLIVEDLPAGLTATVEPQKVSVKIGKKSEKIVCGQGYDPGQSNCGWNNGFGYFS